MNRRRLRGMTRRRGRRELLGEGIEDVGYRRRKRGRDREKAE
jgi:hypothetical protein